MNKDSGKNIVSFISYLLSWILPLAYFSISVMFYLRTYDSCQIKITLLQISGAIVFALWLIKIIERGKIIDKIFYPVLLPLMLFLISGTVSFLHSPFRGASFLEWIRRVYYVVFALVIMDEFRDEAKYRRLIWFTIIAVTISSLYGLIQFLDIKLFPPPPSPGLDPFIWRQAFGTRIFSTHGNPNFFADFLVVMVPIVLSQIFMTQNKILILLFLLITFNVVYTYSKAGWIGYTAAVSAFFLLYGIFFTHIKKKNIVKLIIILVVALIVICGVGVAYFIKQRTDSVKFRVCTWMSTWEMILKRPLLGTGIGTFYLTYPLYRRPQIFFIEGKHNTETDHPEDEYLEVWYDEGLIGFGIFILLILTNIILGLRTLYAYTRTITEIETKEAQPKTKHVRRFLPRVYYLLGVLSSFIGLLMHNFMCVSLRFVSSGIFLGFLLGTIPTTCFLGIETKGVDKQPLVRNYYMRRLLEIVIVIITVMLIKIYYGFFLGDIQHNIAIFYSKQGMWNEALEHYNMVKKYNPYFVMAHYFMGNVFNDRFNLEKTHHPEWGDRVIKKSEINYYLEKYKEDIALGNREFRFNAENNVYEEYRNDAQRALDKYDDVKKLAPNYVQTHHQVGVLYLKLGDREYSLGNLEKARYYYNKALENFEKYKNIDPIFLYNYLRMAYVYTRLGNWQKAEEMYKLHLDSPNICKRGPHNIMWEDWGQRRKNDYSESALNLGNLLLLEGRFTEAEEAYKLSINYNPENVNAWRNLGMLYKKMNRLPEAYNAFSKVLSLNPNDVEVKSIIEGIRK